MLIPSSLVVILRSALTGKPTVERDATELHTFLDVNKASHLDDSTFRKVGGVFGIDFVQFTSQVRGARGKGTTSCPNFNAERSFDSSW